MIVVQCEWCNVTAKARMRPTLSWGDAPAAPLEWLTINMTHQNKMRDGTCCSKNCAMQWIGSLNLEKPVPEAAVAERVGG